MKTFEVCYKVRSKKFYNWRYLFTWYIASNDKEVIKRFYHECRNYNTYVFQIIEVREIK